jgi:Tol biopolymer transport system component
MRLTYLTDHYGAVRFGDYAWSPDGRYVAFWLDMEPETYPDLYDPIEKIVARFAILDTLTQKVTDYCVPNRTLSVPVWSPDGHQVVIENNSQEIFKNSVFLLDITQNFAAKIGEDLSAVGWMK